MAFDTWMVGGRFLCTLGYPPKKTQLSKLIIGDNNRLICLSDTGIDVDSWNEYNNQPGLN